MSELSPKLIFVREFFKTVILPTLVQGERGACLNWTDGASEHSVHPIHPSRWLNFVSQDQSDKKVWINFFEIISFALLSQTLYGSIFWNVWSDPANQISQRPETKNMLRCFSACQIHFLLSSFLFNWYISYFDFDLSHEWTNWHVRWSRHGNRVVIHLFLLHIVYYRCTIHLPLCGFHSSRFTNAASLSDLCGFAADFCGLSHLYLCRLAVKVAQIGHTIARREWIIWIFACGPWWWKDDCQLS